MSKEYKEGQLKTLATLTPHDEGNTCLLKGLVIGQGEVEHYPTLIVTQCPQCNDERTWEQETREKDWRNPNVITKCNHCNQKMFEKQVTKEMLKKVILSEQGVDNPLFITAFVYGEDINKIHPGMSIRAKGVLRSRKARKESMTYRKLFDIIDFQIDDEKPLMPSEEEKKFFHTLDKTKLVESYAPHIRNMLLIKEGLLLACIGGVEKPNWRGDINVLMMGDPGLAKTALLQFATKIVQKSDYASGSSASGAGLFGGIDKAPDGTSYAKAGAAVLCNGGVLAMDEMEKMNQQDRVYAHEVMESQTFTLRKIVPVKWEVKISILGAANPKKSVWNPQLTIKENVNLPATLISRFGLIFLVRDIAVQSEDLAIAEHIQKVLVGQLTESLSIDILKKFINYAKTFKPKSLKESSDLITKWWTELRQETQAEESLAVDIRTLQDIHRLSQAYARMNLSNEVTVEHAKSAIKMLNDSLHTLGMNTPGEKNANITNPKSKREFLYVLFKNSISHDSAVLKMLETRWWETQLDASEQIQKLKSKEGLLDALDGLRWA